MVTGQAMILNFDSIKVKCWADLLLQKRNKNDQTKNVSEH